MGRGEAVQLLADPAIASPAGFVSRVIALAIDTWLLSVSVGAAGFILFAVIGAFRPIASGVDLRAAVPAAMGALVTVLYFIVCWAAFGRTLGMALMGLKALTWDGKRVSLLRAILRYVGYLISVCFVFVGLLWVLFDNRRLGWHDHLARTQVIHVPRMIGHSTSPASLSPAPAAADGP